MPSCKKCYHIVPFLVNSVCDECQQKKYEINTLKNIKKYIDIQPIFEIDYKITEETDL